MKKDYWVRYREGIARIVAIDVARSSVVAVGELVKEAVQELEVVRAGIRKLRDDPACRGAKWERARLSSEIALHERTERRLVIKLAALIDHELRAQSELSKLAPARAATMLLLDAITADHEAAISGDLSQGEEDQDEPLLKEERAAAFLGLSVKTLQNKRVLGDGPPYVKLGPGLRAPVRYRLSVLRAYAESCMGRSSAE